MGLSVSLSVAVSQVSEQGNAEKTPLYFWRVRATFCLITFSPGRQLTYLPRVTKSVSLLSVSLPPAAVSQASEQQKEGGRGGHFHPHALRAKKRVGRMFPSRLPAPERNLRAARISFRFPIPALVVGNGTGILSNQVGGVIFPEMYLTQCG